MNKDEALKKLQEEELDILLAVAKFCDENQITWFLDSGTALGAMRHQGFIPWDDDIDIGMLRKDYDRFLELASTGLPEGYSLHTFENTPGYSGLFAKVYKDGTLFETAETVDAGCSQGIFVDIFPYDQLAIDVDARKRQIGNAQLWKNISYLWHSGKISVLPKGLKGKALGVGCTMAHAILHALVPREAIWSHYQASILDETHGLSSELVILASSLTRQFEIEEMLPPARATFCGHELPVPRETEAYLVRTYGDWRQLPAPENRHTHLPQKLVFSDGSSWSA